MFEGFRPMRNNIGTKQTIIQAIKDNWFRPMRNKIGTKRTR